MNVKAGDTIISWDPYTIPIISTNSGKAEFIHITEGKTIRKRLDPETGVEITTVIAITEELIPRIRIDEREYMLPIGAVLTVKENADVSEGTMIAKIPKKATKTSDITGGLPKVLQILENREIKKSEIIAEIDGEVKVHPPKDNIIELDIIDKCNKVEYKIPIERQINFYNGDRIKTGDIICDGEIDAKDILKIFGVEKAALHIINEVQKVYISQGVSINDRHFEVITKKILGFVKVTMAGDTELVCDEIITKDTFFKINRDCKGKKATAVPVVLGLAQVAKNSDSWLSAASFERTPSVLSSAAIKGLIDDISGVKENVIIGKKIPVGTGHPWYEKFQDT